MKTGERNLRWMEPINREFNGVRPPRRDNRNYFFLYTHAVVLVVTTTAVVVVAVCISNSAVDDTKTRIRLKHKAKEIIWAVIRGTVGIDLRVVHGGNPREGGYNVIEIWGEDGAGSHPVVSLRSKSKSSTLSSHYWLRPATGVAGGVSSSLRQQRGGIVHSHQGRPSAHSVTEKEHSGSGEGKRGGTKCRSQREGMRGGCWIKDAAREMAGKNGKRT